MSKSSFAEKIDNKMKKSINQIPYLNIFEDGEYILRLLPIPNKPDEPAFEKYEIHKSIYHPDFQKNSQFICLGPGCPFCKFAEDFKKHYPKDAWQVVATPYFFWRIENKKTNAINYLKLTLQAQSQLISLVLDMDKQGVSLQDPSNLGRDICLTVSKTATKNGERIFYKFESLMSTESKPVSEKLMEELKMWESVKPLTKLFRVYSFDDAQKIIQNQSIIPQEDTKKKATSKSSLAEEFKKKMNNTGTNDGGENNE